MKYLCLAYYDVKKFGDLEGADLRALVSQCPRHDEELRKTGRLFVQASLGLVAATKSIRPKGGKISVTDGPFTETKEQVGGFFIIDARNMDEALEIASLHPAAHLGERVGWGIEVRPVEAFVENGSEPIHCRAADAFERD